VLDKKCFQFIRVLKTKNVYYYVIPFGLYKIDILLGYTLQPLFGLHVRKPIWVSLAYLL